MYLNKVAAIVHLSRTKSTQRKILTASLTLCLCVPIPANTGWDMFDVWDKRMWVDWAGKKWTIYIRVDLINQYADHVLPKLPVGESIYV